MTPRKKNEFQKSLILNSALNVLFNDTTKISVRYIDRPKLTEQKNPFEYIVPPPPPKWGRNNKGISYFQ